VGERSQRVSDLLHEAGEVHHVVYRITDGADDNWASFSEREARGEDVVIGNPRANGWFKSLPSRLARLVLARTCMRPAWRIEKDRPHPNPPPAARQ
jgi:hypothetical protein